VTASPATLARTYEALRAEAVGMVPAAVPRGLALLRAAGMVAWMAACPPDRTVMARERPIVPAMAPPPSVGREFVGVLTEMALAQRTRLEVMS
jgi:hypothetical protein